jgi:hypothetical protein
LSPLGVIYRWLAKEMHHPSERSSEKKYVQVREKSATTRTSTK